MTLEIKTITSLYIPIRLVERARRLAEERGVSKNALYVEAIRRAVVEADEGEGRDRDAERPAGKA